MSAVGLPAAASKRTDGLPSRRTCFARRAGKLIEETGRGLSGLLRTLADLCARALGVISRGEAR
jgi:hypothetical protein